MGIALRTSRWYDLGMGTRARSACEGEPIMSASLLTKAGVTLLTNGKASPKQQKLMDELGLEAGLLYLLPHMLIADGANLCPAADSCSNYRDEAGLVHGNCFWDSGRGKFNSVFQARARRRAFYVGDRPAFMAQLAREISALEAKANRRNRVPVVRLNGLSDILWETIPVGGQANIFQLFPRVTFYDYTKVLARLARPLPANYHLTYSLSSTNDRNASKALALGYNVAVVFRTSAFPAVWEGRPVINGDAHDFRYLDPSGVIVGLKAKGQAKRDTSGFVREIDSVGLDLARVPAFHRRDGTPILARAA